MTTLFTKINLLNNLKVLLAFLLLSILNNAVAQCPYYFSYGAASTPAAPAPTPGSPATFVTTNTVTNASSGVALFVSAYSPNTCSWLSGGQFGIDNVQFRPVSNAQATPTATDMGPFAIITRHPSAASSCGAASGTYWAINSNFTTGSVRPKGLSFQMTDVDNFNDSCQVLVYSGGALVSYDYIKNGADTSYVRVYTTGGTLLAGATGTGTDLIFNGTGGSNSAPNLPNYYKGVVTIASDPTKEIDSVIVRRYYTSASASISIGNFCWSSAAPLPINLINFSAEREDCNIRATWRTGQETNFSHFELENSADGINFNRVKSVAAKGSDTDYATLLDGNGREGVVYLRLKLVDKGNLVAYSNIVSSSMNCNTFDERITLYPNPANNFAKLQMNVSVGNYTVSIADQVGSMVTQESVEITTVGMMIDLQGIESLSNGVYFIKVNQQGRVMYSEKLVIIR